MAELKAVFTADLSDLKRGEAEAIASTRRVAAAMGQTGSEVDRTSSRIGTGLVGVGKGVLKVGAGIAAVAGTGGLVALAKGFERLNSIDQATAKLDGLGHSAQSVERIMGNALGSVRGTAFGLDEAATVAASTVAAGVKPGKDLEGVLRLVADASTIAGTGMGEMGAIFNKVAASNKIQGDVIAQLNDQGIPIIQLLGKELGVTASEVVDLASKGEINFAQFRAAMEDGLGGAALKSGETFSGSMANVGASVSRIGAGLLGGTFPHLAPMFQGITQALEPLEGRAAAAGDAIGRKLGPALEGAGPALSDLIAKADGFDWSKLDFSDELGDPTSTLGEIRSAVGELSDALSDLDVGEVASALGSTGADGIRVFATVVGFAADHTDKLAAAMPFLVAAYGAVKVAQAAGNVAALASIPIRYQQIAVNAALARANTQLAASLTGTTGAQVAANTAAATGIRGMGRLQVAAKGAAGIAGIGALAVGASTSNDALSTLASVGGGALTGFAVGGPIGGAIGGTVGLLASLAGGAKDAGDAASDSVADWSRLAGTLDEVSGATTLATERAAYDELQRTGTLAALEREGIARRTAVDAVMGEGAARDKVTAVVDRESTAYEQNKARLDEVNASLAELAKLPGGGDERGAALREERDALEATTSAQRKHLDTINEGLGTVQRDADAARERAAATREFTSAIRTLPKEVRTELRAKILNQEDIVRLARDYDLVPKQIRTLIRENGGKATRAEVEKVIFAAGKVPKRISTLVREQGAAKARGTIVDLTRRYNLTPTQVRTLIRESGGQPTRRMVDGIIAASKDLNRQRPRPVLTAEDRLSAAVASAKRVLAGLDGDRATTYIDTVRTTIFRSSGRAVAGMIMRADGGRVAGPGGPREDAIPAWLSNGEYVVNARDTARNLPLLEAMNSGRQLKGGILALADGGPVGTTLDIYQAQAALRDLDAELRARKTRRVKGKGKKAKPRMVDAGPAVTGLDRQILTERRKEAAAELARLRSPAAVDRRQLADGVTSALSFDLFATGATSASQLIRNGGMQAQTNAQWATLITGLNKAKLDRGLIDQFVAQGPTAQALALGKSILSTAGAAGSLNNLGTGLGQQAAAGAAYATTGASPVVNIDKWYAAPGQSETELAERLYFISRVRK